MDCHSRQKAFEGFSGDQRLFIGYQRRIARQVSSVKQRDRLELERTLPYLSVVKMSSNSTATFGNASSSGRLAMPTEQDSDVPISSADEYTITSKTEVTNNPDVTTLAGTNPGYDIK